MVYGAQSVPARTLLLEFKNLARLILCDVLGIEPADSSVFRRDEGVAVIKFKYAFAMFFGARRPPAFGAILFERSRQLDAFDSIEDPSQNLGAYTLVFKLDEILRVVVRDRIDGTIEYTSSIWIKREDGFLMVSKWAHVSQYLVIFHCGWSRYAMVRFL